MDCFMKSLKIDLLCCDIGGHSLIRYTFSPSSSLETRSLPRALDRDPTSLGTVFSGMSFPKNSEQEDKNLFPTEFVGSFFQMPYMGELKNFSFKGRRYLVPIYDTPSQRLLLQC